MELQELFMLKSLFRSERGSISILMVIGSALLIGFAGLAIDTARGYAVKQHLQKAVDAATLAAAKVLDDTTHGSDYPKKVGENYFWNNWRSGYLGAGDVTLNVTFDREAGKATVDARLDLSPIIMGYFGGQDFHFNTVAEAQRKKISLELAIALDNTASMAYGAEPGTYNTVPTDVSKRRIALVKSAAKTLLDTLYEGKDEVPNMYVSVIPFTSMVNVGKDNTQFLRSGSLSGLKWSPPAVTGIPASGPAWNTIFANNDAWRGCVFERGAGKRTGFSVGSDYNGRDLTDDPPTVEAFYPYNVPPPTLVAGVQCRYFNAGSTGTCYTYNCETEGVCTKVPYTCTTGAYAKYDNATLTECRGISSETDKTTWCSYAPGTFGKMCPNNTGTNCAPNRGPARRCFGWDTVQWDKEAPNNSNYALNPQSFWNNFPYLIPQTSTGTAQNYDNANTKNKNGVKGAVALPTFQETGFNIRVVNDDISACGNAANVAGGTANPTDGYYYCSFNASWSGAGTGARFIPSWPSTATTPEAVKLGGWGNSGCGLPIMPLGTQYDDVMGRINAMDVPVNTSIKSGGSETVPARAYYGTIINQGLVWAWRTISPSWRGLWANSSNSLPFNYSDENSTHNKAIIILTDGLNFIQRSTDFDPQGQTNATILIEWNGDAKWRIDHKDYDSTAYGRLTDGWFYKNGNSSVITFGTTATDEATNGPPAYQELNRRLKATCDKIRAKGIKIFLIAFAVQSSSVKDSANSAFNYCVGSTGKYYDAVDEDSLTDAFKDIAAQLIELRLVK